MTDEPALVDLVRTIARERASRRPRGAAAAAEAIRVQFAGGAIGLLDPSSPRDRTWQEVLGSLREANQPAYVEIDAQTGYITTLLLPRRFLVTAVRTTDGDAEVELEISHARHFVRRSQPRFDALLEQLEDARRRRTPVLVTESLDTSTIVDVRPSDLPGQKD